MQDSSSYSETTITDAFKDFYYSFIEQLPHIGMGLLIIILGVLLGTWIGNFTKTRISRRTKDPLMSRFLGRSIRIILIVIAIMIGLRAAGLGGIATGILTAAGASAIVFGFAFKDIGENFIAGVILSFNRPFNVNDTIEVGSNFGKVKALEFRYTKLKSFDGRDIYIPNIDILTKPVINYTEDGFYRWNFTVGIAYEDDIENAKEIILNTLATEPDVIEDEEHENFVIEEELGASSVILKVFFWVDTTDYRRAALIVKGRVIKKIKENLEKAGIYLPANIQELKLYGKEKNLPLKLMGDKEES
ncbi:hypothetical protein BH23BAC2_BH23BAC2_06950 [soil metagenome]